MPGKQWRCVGSDPELTDLLSPALSSIRWRRGRNHQQLRDARPAAQSREILFPFGHWAGNQSGHPMYPMNMLLRCVVVLFLACHLASAQTPPRPRGGARGGMGSGVPDLLQFNGALGKLFGDHKSFVAVMEVEAKQGSGDDNITLPTKLSFLDGNTRIEMDLSRAKGSQIPPGAADQLKAMGMTDMTMISREDKQIAFLVYPGLTSYAEMKSEGSKLKMDTTELGKETMDGHPCVKNKVTVTEANGKVTDSTVWKATDMKKFPVRIETADGKNKVTMKFKDVIFAKPASALFDPPAGYTRYDNVQTMQEQVMKKMLGGAGAKPGK